MHLTVLAQQQMEEIFCDYLSFQHTQFHSQGRIYSRTKMVSVLPSWQGKRAQEQHREGPQAAWVPLLGIERQEVHFTIAVAATLASGKQLGLC